MSQMIYGEPGSFCWAELFTSDDKLSRDFYAKLFSWNYTESPAGNGSHYTHANISEGSTAGMMEIDKTMKKHGVMPHWNSYISVPDADAVVAEAVLMGATVILPVTDVPNAGRMAILKDPTGAHISLWQSKGENKSAPRDAHGMVGWNELLTHDVSLAQKFYTKVFGWEALEENVNGGAYVSFTKDKRFVGGMMAIVPEMGPMPSSWTVYFTTKNLEKSRQVAKENGAHELSPVIDLPNIGKLMVIKDVVGAVFSLFEWAPKM